MRDTKNQNMPCSLRLLTTNELDNLNVKWLEELQETYAQLSAVCARIAQGNFPKDTQELARRCANDADKLYWEMEIELEAAYATKDDTAAEKRS